MRTLLKAGPTFSTMPMRTIGQQARTNKWAAVPLLMAVSLFISMSTLAADAGGNYAIWGVGQSSCHKFLKSREADESRQYKDYLMGYLTAFNTLSDDTYNISGKTKLGEIEQWLAGYCDLHQIESFNRAIQQYATEHFDARLTVSPGSSKGWGAKSTK